MEVVEDPSRNLKKQAKAATRRVDVDFDGDVDKNDTTYGGDYGEFVPSADGKKKLKTGRVKFASENFDPNKEKQLMQKQHQLDKQRMKLKKQEAQLDAKEPEEDEEEDDNERLTPSEKLMKGPQKYKTTSITDRIMKGKDKKVAVPEAKEIKVNDSDRKSQINKLQKKSSQAPETTQTFQQKDDVVQSWLNKNLSKKTGQAAKAAHPKNIMKAVKKTHNAYKGTKAFLKAPKATFKNYYKGL